LGKRREDPEEERAVGRAFFSLLFSSLLLPTQGGGEPDIGDEVARRARRGRRD
jgi:hypothetical protein